MEISAGRFAFEFFTGASVGSQSTTRALLDDVLPILKAIGAYDKQSCYFERLKTEGVERVRLCFTDFEQGQGAFARLKEVRERAFLPAPFRVAYSPAGMLSDIVVGPRAGELFERFSCTAAPMLLDWMQLIEAGERRLLSLAFDLMAIHILRRALRDDDSAIRPYPRAFLTYRSHADGFFVLSSDGRRTRSIMEERYRKVADWSRERLLELDRMTKSGGLPADLESWSDHMIALIRASCEAVEANQMGFAGGTGYIGDNSDLSESRFHQSIQASPGFRWFMRSNPRFLATRLGTGLLYLSLRRLGLPLLDRYFLCHSIARTIEDIHDLDPVKEMHEFFVSVITPGKLRFLSPLVRLLLWLGPQPRAS